MKNHPGDRKIFNIFRLCFLVLLVLSVLGTVIYSAANPQKESWESDVIRYLTPFFGFKNLFKASAFIFGIVKCVSFITQIVTKCLKKL